jgi:hypothetical protein
MELARRKMMTLMITSKGMLCSRRRMIYRVMCLSHWKIGEERRANPLSSPLVLQTEMSINARSPGALRVGDLRRGRRGG